VFVFVCLCVCVRERRRLWPIYEQTDLPVASVFARTRRRDCYCSCDRSEKSRVLHANFESNRATANGPKLTNFALAAHRKIRVDPAFGAQKRTFANTISCQSEKMALLVMSDYRYPDQCILCKLTAHTCFLTTQMLLSFPTINLSIEIFQHPTS